MVEQEFETIAEDLRKQLDSSRQNWLFGAGISCESNIPLMYPLTARVKKIIDDSGYIKNHEIYKVVESELVDNSHVEHFLSHLGDLITIASRSRFKTANLGGKSYEESEFLCLYNAIILAISTTVRYGYYKKDGEEEKVGNVESPIVEINHHVNFVKSLISNRSNLMSRSKLSFFTTNYDTLLEDALGIENITVIDGFSGGSLGYWNPQIEFSDLNKYANKCLLYKLHGSIDWQYTDDRKLIRARYGTKYLSTSSQIMIYPQATKYVETQKDPFSYLFHGFRQALNASEDNVLITCGYSFGDQHINLEIESALSSRNNRTTLIVFIKESLQGGIVINPILDK
ncbi:SIR2 family protein [Olivibacter oleidegradans]|uniref:SIR2 family protein n=1 Tax=Olivibacter oleidegradans TaxID=760123 RepID=A0ABV6HMZ9_9SPHI